MQLKPVEFDAMINKYKENGLFKVHITETKDKHFRIYYIDPVTKKEKYVVRTKRSLGSKSMEWLINKIKRQLGLTNSELQDLKDCPLRSNDIEKLYKERRII